MEFVKTVLFRIHWLLGLVGGVVLAVVGATGAVLSFETAMIAALNPGIVTVAAGPAERLSPVDLLARIVARNPDRRVVGFEVSFHGDRTPRVGFAPPDAAAGRRAEWRYVDPHTGDVLGIPSGEAFFRTTRELHRYLVAGDVGKQIVGASTVALAMLVMTGIYLRWPRNAHSWRSWIQIDFRLRGRAFLYRLHSVVGTWLLPIYLVAALTGLTWSYEWYRGGVYAALGAPLPPRPSAAASADEPPVDVAAMWRSIWPVINANADAIETATITFPDARTNPAEVRYLPVDAPHERAFDKLSIDGASGEVISRERYADKPVGARVAASIFPLHRGSFFGTTGTVLTMLASVLMPVFAVTGLLMYIERRRPSKLNTPDEATLLSRRP